MTKTLSMVSHKNYNLNANEGLVILFTSKFFLIALLMVSLQKMKSQSIAYLLYERKHIYWIWTLKTKYTSTWVYEQTPFKNMKAILFFEVGWSGHEHGLQL